MSAEQKQPQQPQDQERTRGRDRFDRFTIAAKKSLVNANDEAIFSGSNFIDDGHLLLGAMQAGAGKDFFEQRMITIDTVRNALALYRQPNTTEDMKYLPLTPNAKLAVELSVETAKQTHTRRITPDHLLAGLTQLEGTQASAVLQDLAIDKEALLRETRNAILLAKAKENSEKLELIKGMVGDYKDFLD